MTTKSKPSERELASCPHCKCRIKAAKLKPHLQNVHLIKKFVTIHECAQHFRINENKVIELALQFGCTVKVSTDRIPMSIAKQIRDVFAFRTQTGVRRPKRSPTDTAPRFVEGGLPSLGKNR